MKHFRLRNRILAAVYGAATLGTLLYTVGAPWRTI